MSTRTELWRLLSEYVDPEGDDTRDPTRAAFSGGSVGAVRVTFPDETIDSLYQRVNTMTHRSFTASVEDVMECNASRIPPLYEFTRMKGYYTPTQKREEQSGETVILQYMQFLHIRQMFVDLVAPLVTVEDGGASTVSTVPVRFEVRKAPVAATETLVPGSPHVRFASPVDDGGRKDDEPTPHSDEGDTPKVEAEAYQNFKRRMLIKVWYAFIAGEGCSDEDVDPLAELTAAFQHVESSEGILFGTPETLFPKRCEKLRKMARAPIGRCAAFVRAIHEGNISISFGKHQFVTELLSTEWVPTSVVTNINTLIFTCDLAASASGSGGETECRLEMTLELSEADDRWFAPFRECPAPLSADAEADFVDQVWTAVIHYVRNKMVMIDREVSSSSTKALTLPPSVYSALVEEGWSPLVRPTSGVFMYRSPVKGHRALPRVIASAYSPTVTAETLRNALTYVERKKEIASAEEETEPTEGAEHREVEHREVEHREVLCFAPDLYELDEYKAIVASPTMVLRHLLRKGCYYLMNESGEMVRADFNGVVFVLATDGQLLSSEGEPRNSAALKALIAGGFATLPTSLL